MYYNYHLSILFYRPYLFRTQSKDTQVRDFVILIIEFYLLLSSPCLLQTEFILPFIVKPSINYIIPVTASLLP